MPQHGVEFEGLSFRGVRGKGLRTLLLGPYALARRVPRRALRSSAAACPTSCSASADSRRSPAGSWARRAGKPLVLHDANAVAGLANARARATAPIASCSAFPHALRGTPREDRANGSAIRCATRSARCRRPTQRFAGRDGPLRLLVVGGSLGAQALNERRARGDRAACRATRGRSSSIRRANGTSRRCATRTRGAGVEAECVAFIDDMAARYAWADFVICRGGALTISELAAVGLGALVVPLPGAIADEQSANAQFLVDARRAPAMEPQADADAGAPGGAARSRSIARARSRWRRPRTRTASATPPRASPTSCIALAGRAHEAQGQARALRRHRRRRHERHRRGARDAGLCACRAPTSPRAR